MSIIVTLGVEAKTLHYISPFYYTIQAILSTLIVMQKIKNKSPIHIAPQKGKLRRIVREKPSISFR
jgi:hypothetical protein